METFRYVVAVLFVISLPPAIGWWVIVHPFVGFWRRVGTKGTFVFLTVVFLGTVAALYLVRGGLLGSDYGTRWGLVAAGVPFIVAAVVIQYHRKKHLTWKILAGGPEIAPVAGDDGQTEGLLCEGIYARVRHPRYAEFLLGSIGWTMILNYQGVYLMTAVAVVAIVAVVVPLEERELRERFGEAYVEYSRRVPRFIPRMGSTS